MLPFRPGKNKVSLADEAVRIGPAPALESYLKGDAILDAARRSGAQVRKKLAQKWAPHDPTRPGEKA